LRLERQSGLWREPIITEKPYHSRPGNKRVYRIIFEAGRARGSIKAKTIGGKALSMSNVSDHTALSVKKSTEDVATLCFSDGKKEHITAMPKRSLTPNKMRPVRSTIIKRILQSGEHYIGRMGVVDC
jgi:hypothetical protein